ncbi:MAG: DUF1573 domain-containing protein [Bacteroidetes bacterium]|nr:DUF1573 domain-containing protein [Bacteroidota bacterium]
MKKFISILFVMIVAPITIGMHLAAQTTVVADPNAPIITFQSEVIDFGNVQQGSEAIREFTFTNTGKSSLIISSIKGACGCTTFPESWPKDPIPPGGTATFKVKYDTAIRVGMFDKKIMVSSNASNGLVEVKIKGTVIPVGAPASGGN